MRAIAIIVFGVVAITAAIEAIKVLLAAAAYALTAILCLWALAELVGSPAHA